MIRTLKLVCSECKENFIPNGLLYYRDNYISSIRETNFICPDCIEKWQAKWHIKNAVFHEVDYVMTVDIELEDGSVYTNMDCTPIDETQTVVTGEDIPEEAQKCLYKLYAVWDNERKAHYLKNCTFQDKFMRASFSCETYGGEKFNDVAFRFNMRGEIETEVPVPDYILQQVIDAYRVYEAQNEKE